MGTFHKGILLLLTLPGAAVTPLFTVTHELFLMAGLIVFYAFASLEVCWLILFRQIIPYLNMTADDQRKVDGCSLVAAFLAMAAFLPLAPDGLGGTLAERGLLVWTLPLVLFGGNFLLLAVNLVMGRSMTVITDCLLAGSWLPTASVFWLWEFYSDNGSGIARASGLALFGAGISYVLFIVINLRQQENRVARPKWQILAGAIPLVLATAFGANRVWISETYIESFDQLDGIALGDDLRLAIDSEGPPTERWACKSETHDLACLSFENSPHSGDGKLEVCAVGDPHVSVDLVVSVAYQFPASGQDASRPRLARFDRGPTWSKLPSRYRRLGGGWTSRCSEDRWGSYYANNIFLLKESHRTIRYGVSSLRGESLRMLSEIEACCSRTDE